jgi:acetyl esterase/lipase
VDALPARPADARIPYGSDPLNYGDLRLPSGRGPFPVAVVVHGGCWISKFATLQNTAALSDALREAGIATWNVEYRRLDQTGGGWPGTFLDAAAAADHVRALAKAYPLDLERVVAVGHSAGAHLALWLAGRHRLPADSEVRRGNPLKLAGAIALGGPGDLRDFTTYAASICGSPVIEQLLGGPPDSVPRRYAQASPAELLPLGTPQLLIVGELDGVMPPASCDRYVAAARKAGDRIDLVVIPNAGHFEVIAPTTIAWPIVRDRILELSRGQRRSRERGHWHVAPSHVVQATPTGQLTPVPPSPQ